MKSRIALLSLAAIFCASCSIQIRTSSFESPSQVSEAQSESANSSAGEVEISSEPGDREDATISFYAINDFHGSVLAKSNQPGIESIGAYLKSVRDVGGVLICSGDMYQGSIESDYNHGEVLSKCMKEIGFDAFAIGNHEFDWGAEWIVKNAEFAGMDFLGANIYNYDMETGEVGDFASELCAKYNIVERGGWKIGIIGTIGYDQITSICSPFVDDYSFIDPIPVIKTLSDELRLEKGCDAVVVSHHGEQAELMNKGLTSISPESGARYIDAAFCAHSHQNESATENGVAFVQTEGYGKSIARISLDVKDDGVTLNSYTTRQNAYGLTDGAIKAIVDEYKAVSDVAGNEVLCRTDSTYYDRYDMASNLIVKAIGEHEESLGVTYDFAVSNYARAGLSAAGYQITYSSLYTTLPFDNEIVIARVKGSELIRELAYTSTYAYRPQEITLSATSYYTIAVVDFLALHRGTSRKYDYFPTLEVISVQSGVTYRDIAANYLRSLDQFKGSEHTSSLSCFNKNAF